MENSREGGAVVPKTQCTDSASTELCWNQCIPKLETTALKVGVVLSKERFLSADDYKDELLATILGTLCKGGEEPQCS